MSTNISGDSHANNQAFISPLEVSKSLPAEIQRIGPPPNQPQVSSIKQFAAKVFPFLARRMADTAKNAEFRQKITDVSNSLKQIEASIKDTQSMIVAYNKTVSDPKLMKEFITSSMAEDHTDLKLKEELSKLRSDWHETKKELNKLEGKLAESPYKSASQMRTLRSLETKIDNLFKKSFSNDPIFSKMSTVETQTTRLRELENYGTLRKTFTKNYQGQVDSARKEIFANKLGIIHAKVSTMAKSPTFNANAKLSKQESSQLADHFTALETLKLEAKAVGDYSTASLAKSLQYDIAERIGQHNYTSVIRTAIAQTASSTNPLTETQLTGLSNQIQELSSLKKQAIEQNDVMLKNLIDSTAISYREQIAEKFADQPHHAGFLIGYPADYRAAVTAKLRDDPEHKEAHLESMKMLLLDPEIGHYPPGVEVIRDIATSNGATEIQLLARYPVLASRMHDAIHNPYTTLEQKVENTSKLLVALRQEKESLKNDPQLLDDLSQLERYFTKDIHASSAQYEAEISAPDVGYEKLMEIGSRLDSAIEEAKRSGDSQLLQGLLTAKNSLMHEKMQVAKEYFKSQVEVLTSKRGDDRKQFAATLGDKFNSFLEQIAATEKNLDQKQLLETLQDLRILRTEIIQKANYLKLTIIPPTSWRQPIANLSDKYQLVSDTAKESIKTAFNLANKDPSDEFKVISSNFTKFMESENPDVRGLIESCLNSVIRVSTKKGLEISLPPDQVADFRALLEMIIFLTSANEDGTLSPIIKELQNCFDASMRDQARMLSEAYTGKLDTAFADMDPGNLEFVPRGQVKASPWTKESAALGHLEQKDFSEVEETFPDFKVWVQGKAHLKEGEFCGDGAQVFSRGNIQASAVVDADQSLATSAEVSAAVLEVIQKRMQGPDFPQNCSPEEMKNFCLGIIAEAQRKCIEIGKQCTLTFNMYIPMKDGNTLLMGFALGDAHASYESNGTYEDLSKDLSDRDARDNGAALGDTLRSGENRLFNAYVKVLEPGDKATSASDFVRDNNLLIQDIRQKNPGMEVREAAMRAAELGEVLFETAPIRLAELERNKNALDPNSDEYKALEQTIQSLKDAINGKAGFEIPDLRTADNKPVFYKADDNGGLQYTAPVRQVAQEVDF